MALPIRYLCGVALYFHEADNGNIGDGPRNHPLLWTFLYFTAAQHFSTYYFQALMKPKAAFIVSVARGFIISGILIMVLPAVAGADSIWLAMPVTELAVAVYAAHTIVKYTKKLSFEKGQRL